MNPKDIKELINILPSIFIFIVPGYLYFSFFNYVLNWKEKTFKNNIFEYVIFSYILYSISYFVLNIFYKNKVIMDLPEVTIGILLSSCVLGYIIGRFVQSKAYTKVRKRLKINRTINNNIFYDIVDRTKGTWARVYLKDEKLVYYGAIVLFEKKDKYEDGFIVLNNYYAYKYGEASIYENTLPEEERENYFVTIKVSEISRIETIYAEDSELVNDLLKREDSNSINVQDIIENENYEITN
ncbi:hypothetical protein [Clostridium perfringens]|uniref:hypothetical protein n=2 Tax=Clostridium perfringens TaxID=1502 RepID=UPI000D716A4E|nr:hypothetical protein [Clostridium perfringens]MDU2139767.1 hypothetical protein [Streptococcus mitis]MDK0700752.1 hypothetical protein [Clostridium perfringens]MDK0732496.1 hypothetical protein [Clostridium perfringens]MDM0934228.1 hypothetical protein [Clostridium perfringens]MDU2093384.1 hypothetical protein [Clostridium perfringens]